MQAIAKTLVLKQYQFANDTGDSQLGQIILIEIVSRQPIDFFILVDILMDYKVLAMLLLTFPH